jgi:hypothetical protein
MRQAVAELRRGTYLTYVQRTAGGCRVSRTYLRNTVAAYGTGQYYYFLAAGSSASATSWVMLQW